MDARTPIESSTSRVALSVSFNLACDCFIVATNYGFSVFDAATCKQLAKRYLKEGGVGLAQIFGRSNVIPLVGGGKRPVRSPAKVVIWDEKKVEFTREITCLSRIRGLRVVDCKVVVLLQEEVRIYPIGRTSQLETRYPTVANPLGLCSVSRTHLAFPGRTSGQVQLVHIETQAVRIIPAHASALGAIALSRDGALLATASEKGTLVRVWATATSARLAELRRGVDQVTVFSLGFNPSGTLLACTSDKGTLHIFDVPPHSGGASSSEGGGGGSGSSRRGGSSSHPAELEGADWTYEDSDVGSLPYDTRGGDGGSDGSRGRWGVLGRLPFMPQYFRDTVSFASAEFALDDGPGPSRQREIEEAATMRWSRLPRGVLGWTNDDTVVVLGAGVEPKYERFVISTGNDGRRVCVRQVWANYLQID